MPWAKDDESGLLFAALATSFNAFEAQMRRMAGAEDGIRDGLLQFSQPISGSHCWCPPPLDGKRNLRATGLQALSLKNSQTEGEEAQLTKY